MYTDDISIIQSYDTKEMILVVYLYKHIHLQNMKHVLRRKLFGYRRDLHHFS